MAGLLMVVSALVGAIALVSDWVVDSALGTGRWRFSGVEVLADAFGVKTGVMLLIGAVFALVLGVSGVLLVGATIERRATSVPWVLSMLGALGWLALAAAGWTEVATGADVSGWQFGVPLMTFAGLLGLVAATTARRARRARASSTGTAMVTAPRAVGAVG